MENDLPGEIKRGLGDGKLDGVKVENFVVSWRRGKEEEAITVG